MNIVFSTALRITKDPRFSGFVLFLILLSSFLVGIETYPGIASKYKYELELLDRLIILFFSLEIGIKILSKGSKPYVFFTDPWNVFDFVIVGVCLIPTIDTHFFTVLRIIRILRILRMITFFPKLRLLIGTLLKSIPSMGYIILLISILFYVYAIVGVFSFGSSDPAHFGDLHHAFVTLFKVLTLEGWTDIMNTQIYGQVGNASVQIVSFWPFLYFASFILVGAMIIMNLFIGVIMNSMQESQNELSREIQDLKYQDKYSDELFLDVISKIDELRQEIQFLKNRNQRK